MADPEKTAAFLESRQAARASRFCRDRGPFLTETLAAVEQLARRGVSSTPMARPDREALRGSSSARTSVTSAALTAYGLFRTRAALLLPLRLWRPQLHRGAAELPCGATRSS